MSSHILGPGIDVINRRGGTIEVYVGDDGVVKSRYNKGIRVCHEGTSRSITVSVTGVVEGWQNTISMEGNVQKALVLNPVFFAN